MFDKIDFHKLTWMSFSIYCYSACTFLFSIASVLLFPSLYNMIGTGCDVTCRVGIYVLFFQYVSVGVALALYWYKGIGRKRRDALMRVASLSAINVITSVLALTQFLFLIGIFNDEGERSIYMRLSDGAIVIYTVLIVIFSFYLFNEDKDSDSSEP